jgi:hypothetical protein
MQIPFNNRYVTLGEGFFACGWRILILGAFSGSNWPPVSRTGAEGGRSNVMRLPVVTLQGGFHGKATKCIGKTNCLVLNQAFVTASHWEDGSVAFADW